jgi:TPR repeat protein
MFFAFRRFLNPFFGLIIGVLSIPAVAAADPLQDGLASYDHGDYQTAKRLLDPLAAGGDADAQLTLGLIFAKGLGVRQDIDIAQIWFRRAADNPAASKETQADAAYNRDFILKKNKESADAVELAGKIQALKAAQDAAERRKQLEEAQIDRERAETRYVRRRVNDRRDAERGRLLQGQQRSTGRWAN